jgi:LysM repeat protein
MARRNPARFLAPIALVAFAFVLYSVVQDAKEPAGGKSGAPAGATASPTATSKASKKKKSSKKKTYTVKSGDTPSGIAEKTGVSLDTLQELNPDLDPSTLAPGQRIKLSE